jgi:rhodanese-related sulfurtransferase
MTRSPEGREPEAPRTADLQISCSEVREKIRREECFRFIDLRGGDLPFVRIERAEIATEEMLERLLAEPRFTEIVFFCEHGIASLEVAGFFREQGFPLAQSMSGGMQAWSMNAGG